jgi:hypothetical protein
MRQRIRYPDFVMPTVELLSRTGFSTGGYKVLVHSRSVSGSEQCPVEFR